MNGDDEDENEKMIRRRGGWLVGFDGSIMMMRGTDTRLECGCFAFLLLLFFFLFFLLFFPFLSPAHIWGEKSGSMGSTH